MIKIVTTPKFKRDFNFSSSFMKTVGDNLKKRIKKRTKSGSDVDNKRFKRYTTKYAKLKGVSRSAVNLKSNGDMLSAINVSPKKNSVAITATDYKAKYHQYMGAGKSKVIRKWFGAGKDSERIVMVLINREFRKLARKRK